MVGMDNQGIGLASEVSLLPGFGAQEVLRTFPVGKAAGA